jgi:hypothetical protein
MHNILVAGPVNLVVNLFTPRHGIKPEDNVVLAEKVCVDLLEPTRHQEEGVFEDECFDPLLSDEGNWSPTTTALAVSGALLGATALAVGIDHIRPGIPGFSHVGSVFKNTIPNAVHRGVDRAYEFFHTSFRNGTIPDPVNP